MNFARNAQRVIDRYLRRVQRKLRHLEPAERREIVDGLRAHIHESLSERGVSPVRAEDVRAVLSTMDSPQGYQSDDSIKTSARTDRSRWYGRMGLYFLLAAAVVFAVGLLLGLRMDEAIFVGSLIVCGVLTLCALGLGIAGWRSPYGKATVICAVVIVAVALMFIPVRRVSSSAQAAPEISGSR